MCLFICSFLCRWRIFGFLFCSYLYRTVMDEYCGTSDIENHDQKVPTEYQHWRVSGLLYQVSNYGNHFFIIKYSYNLAPEQLDWQAQELGVLIHFNMATYIENHDACPRDLVVPISRFNPYLLDTGNWAQTIVDFGAKYAVLVAKVKSASSLWQIFPFVDHSITVDFSYHQRTLHFHWVHRAKLYHTITLSTIHLWRV